MFNKTLKIIITKKHQKGVIAVVFEFLLSTLNILHNFFCCVFIVESELGTYFNGINFREKWFSCVIKFWRFRKKERKKKVKEVISNISQKFIFANGQFFFFILFEDKMRSNGKQILRKQ